MQTGTRVLIVDDHRESADAMAALMEMYGLTAQCAYAGEDALRIARSFIPHIALLDLDLSDMTGVQLAQLMQALLYPHPMRIFAVSGHDSAHIATSRFECSFDAHFLKPVDPERLIDAITS